MPTQDDTDRVEFEIAAKMKAAFMLSGSNNTRYEELKEYLENRYTVAQADEYLRFTICLLSTMNNFRVPNRHNGKERERPTPPSIDDGVNFVQEGEDEPEEAQ